MATYVFETMTAAQAATYASSTDQILFTNSPSHAYTMSVAFITTGEPPSATTLGSTTVTGATLTDLIDGKSVTFGTGILGESDFIFPDGSKLLVGATGVDAVSGTTAGDG